MTRRIAFAILATVWTTLIACGFVSYFVTRAVLLKELDDSIIRYACALPAIKGHPEFRPNEERFDAYVVVIQGPDFRQTPHNFGTSQVLPVVREKNFVQRGDGWYRYEELIFQPSTVDGLPLRVLYSLPTDNFVGSLNRLRYSLVLFGVIAGIAAAAVAGVVSRRALRPLRYAAKIIGEINEQKIDRRIDAESLPDELKPVADCLNQMLGRLDLAFSQRKQFLADASHELRTPIAGLLTTIEVALRRPRDTTEYVRTLKICLSDARLLRQLVQTLLEHARSESAPETAETFNLVSVLNQCADVADGLASGREIGFSRSMPEHLKVTTHPNRIRGIVMNLLGNAIEHNRAGGTVELHCEVQDTLLEICVSDTGPGIPPEHLPHIFQPFYRAAQGEQPEDTRQHLGLGLFLVDSHIKALGGECRIESKVGVGTTFRIRLPGAVAAQPKALEAAAV